MGKITVNGFGLTTMCRLCLSRGVTVLDMFAFSTEFMDQVADIVMKCAPVQITRCDEMPNFICQSCYTQLEKSHQFQKQVVEADKTLRRYLQQLRTSNKQIKAECSIQGRFENSCIPSTNTDITVKCESSEFQDVFKINVNLKEEVPSNYTSAYKINEEISLKYEFKEEPLDDKSGDPLIHNTNTNITVKCESLELKDVFDLDVNMKEKVPSNYTSAHKISEEMSLKSEIKEEPMDDYSSIPTECTENLIETLAEGDGSQTSFENSDVDKKTANFTRLRSDDLKKYAVKRENENKHSSKNCKKYKKSKKINYKCDLCNKQFSFLCRFNIHKRKHTGEKPYECDVCTMCFTESSELKVHKRTHTGEKPYKCDVCSKCFSQSSILNVHKRAHTGEKPYKCDVCSICFTVADHLKVHKRTHTGEKPYKCDVCCMRFRQSSTLSSHKRRHTGERPYKCDVCSTSFAVSSHLKVHERMHTGEKPYKCDVCSMCFAVSSHLKVHKRTHTREKPYKCDLCSKCFRQWSALDVHKRTHTGEKPYKCDVCSKCFRQSCYLKVHNRTHTREKPYKCDVCSMCFSQSGQLTNHKRKHTGQK